MWWLLLAVPPLVPFGMTLVNVFTWRRGKVGWVETSANESISILIPARNEAENIVAAVEAAMDPFQSTGCLEEVIVYDDNSTDGTAELVRNAFCSDDRVRVVNGKSLPEGWVGKPHACQRLLEEAQGDILLFLDADVRLKPEAAPRLLGFFDPAHQADLVSAVPRQTVGGFFERLVLPLLILTYTSWLPLRLVEMGRRPSTVAANGQIMMMRRRVAIELGGFEAIRAEIVDDVALCRHAKVSGYKVLFADGFHVGSCRMYRSTTEVWQGFSKNLYDGIGGSVINLLGVLTLHLLCFVAPYVALLVALFFPQAFVGLFLPAAVGVSVNLLLRSLLALRFAQPWEGILLHPFSVLALCVIALNSLRRSLSGRNEWAGRFYPSRRERLRRVALSTADGGGGNDV